MARFPSLPSADDDPTRRAEASARDRSIWQFDHTWHGLTFPHPDSMVRSARAEWFGSPGSWPHLPENLAVLVGVGPSWLGPSAGWLARAAVNNRFGAVLQRDNARPVSAAAHRSRRIHGWLDRIQERVFDPGPHDPTPAPYSHRTPRRIEDYEDAFATVEPPAAVDCWAEDWWFARERVAGTSPVTIAVADGTTLAKVPLTAARFAAVTGGDSLDAAVAEHRFFAVDHSMLDGIGAGISYGWRKYLCAPVALLALTPDRRTLRPVAIQCGQVHDPARTPVFTPADGIAWEMAKLTFTAAESNYHGVVEHGTLCHMVIGATGLAMRRTLAPWHPVRVLLEPNIEYTIPIALATKNLFEPGGRTPTLQAVSPESCIDLVERAWRRFDWTERTGDREFERRGVLDPEVLPHYPMRDDLALSSDAIAAFVDDYVSLYYDDDAAVLADVELQAWHGELVSPSGADLPTVPHLDTVAALAWFLHAVIWRASPYHAVINYSVFDSMGFVPNMPTAVYAPPPVADTEYDRGHLLSLLPPTDDAADTITDVVHVANLRLNRLGHYDAGHFADARVAPLVDRFEAALRAAGTVVDERNLSRPAPYRILHPANITASIHI